ncbi:MAG TPA: nicotinamide-nucleotide amidohydrolase family protein [Pseudonocardiaceae bacterium]|nr:nicotinamide-nucleotide amidohydrolase family protein [Pseudonocardiaceae bacterium]
MSTRVAEVVELLVARGQTVATAESLTAGMVTAALTTVPGSSAVVRGGLVVYATDLKTSLAGVPAELLAEHGAVHPDVAVALASGARRVCGADWGVGLTGVAGPDPQDGVAPGRVYLGIAQSAGVTCYTLDVAGNRHAVRTAAVTAAIDHLHAALTG